MVTQTNTNYDLLVLCVTCEQRPLVYHEKQRPLVSPRKMFMCPYDKSAIIIEIYFFIFTKNLRSRLQSVRTSRKTDFRKLKITLVTMTYHSQRPQCPSLSSLFSCSYIVHSGIVYVYNILTSACSCSERTSIGTKCCITRLSRTGFFAIVNLKTPAIRQ